VRSILIIVLGLTGFAAIVVTNHRRGVRLHQLDSQIPSELAARAALGVRPAEEARGYRFSWVEGEGFVPILVASPLRYGETGVRWFATRDGGEVYEFDGSLFAVPDAGPPTRPLQKYLAMTERQRSESDQPAGWKPCR
jgi:hypothetical protein